MKYTKEKLIEKIKEIVSNYYDFDLIEYDIYVIVEESNKYRKLIETINKDDITIIKDVFKNKYYSEEEEEEEESKKYEDLDINILREIYNAAKKCKKICDNYRAEDDFKDLYNDMKNSGAYGPAGLMYLGDGMYINSKGEFIDY